MQVKYKKLGDLQPSTLNPKKAPLGGGGGNSEVCRFGGLASVDLPWPEDLQGASSRGVGAGFRVLGLGFPIDPKP